MSAPAGWSRRSTSCRSSSASGSVLLLRCWRWPAPEAATIPREGPRSSWLRRMTWTLGMVALLYVALLVVLWLIEARLIYFPGAERTLTPARAELDLGAQRVEFVTADDVRLVGWAMPAAAATNAYWLLICHGNAGNLSQFDRPVHYARLRRLGLNLLAFDYRGYGESAGSASESGLYQDADAAYRYLREELKVPADRIIIFGHSLGSAVAVDLASRVPVAGLIVEGALSSVVQRGQELYPFVPVRWMARNRF